MTQSKFASLIESLSNVFIGYSVALASQLLIFPLFDIDISLSENLLIGLWFTAVSVIRSYVLRRWFNSFLKFKPSDEPSFDEFLDKQLLANYESVYQAVKKAKALRGETL